MKLKIRGLLLLLLGLLINCKLLAQQTNLALHKPVAATSQDAKYPAKNVVDGIINRHAKWMSANGKAPHMLEIDLQKYCAIEQLNIYTGIPDEEKLPDEKIQASGFFSAKNFKFQYWDDANWTDFPQTEVLENRSVKVSFKFKLPITTYKIRFICDDGEPISIMEIEALGTPALNMPMPPSFTSGIKKPVGYVANQSLTIKVSPQIVGSTLKYVGYNQGYFFPGSNVSGWLEYSGVNSVRVWATMSAFVPVKSVQVDSDVKDILEFDRRKKQLRDNPEHNSYIKWQQLDPLYQKMDSSSTNAMVFDYALKELKRLKIEGLLQMNGNDFDERWQNKWQQWQRYYALAFHAAKIGDVSMFAMQNEPNHVNSGPMKMEQWIAGMQIVSDAIHSAVEDVNKLYHKNLIGRFVGPVTAGQNTDWWSAVSKAVRTDYHGRTTGHDLIDIFSTHSYNSPAAGYAERVNNIRKIIKENHPNGESMPIVFTEIGRWMNAYLIDKEETMDSPSLFTEWAGIYANNMKNGGYGMWAFKFANTSSGPYPEGIKSGHHLTWHGRRIIEDAYHNLALGKPVSASFATKQWPAKAITDGLKTDQSAWRSDSTGSAKWLEIDLGSMQKLGSAVIYTGSGYGVFTGTDRVKNFKLQYLDGKEWKDILGTEEKNCKYVQLYQTFTNPVITTKVRWISFDPGVLKVREIKLFAQGDGPEDIPDYNISGIHRTGEVVHLFAKGFKDQLPLLKTTTSVSDGGLDAYNSYNAQAKVYYLWLVQRGDFIYHTKIDLKQLPIPAGALVTAETVSSQFYGEVTVKHQVNVNRQLQLDLAPQSVTLLTINSNTLITKHLISPVSTLTVRPGNQADQLTQDKKVLEVALNAANPSQNRVAYIQFSTERIKNACRVLLHVYGQAADDKGLFRLHVYAIPDSKKPPQKQGWKNAPLLDDKEALIHNVGQKAFVAGELAFDHRLQLHTLDVTDIVKRHGASQLTFALIRETRELGDDGDKGRTVLLQPIGSKWAPKLEIYTGQ